MTRRWLSKRLFQDTFRLENLAAGESDVGVKRLDRAVEDLIALEGDGLPHATGQQDAAA